jgi:hypothetical protein
VDAGGCLFWFFILLIFIITLISLCVAHVARAARERTKQRGALGERIAQKLNGTLEHLRESGGIDVLLVQFKLQGRESELEVRYSGTEDAHTRIAVDVRGISRGALKIFPDDVPAFFKKLLRMQDIVVGNEAFDREFIVQATPESFAGQIFSKERRSRAVGIVRRVARLGAASLDLTAEEFSFKVRRVFDDVGPLLSLVEAASAWLEILLEIAPAADVYWLPAETAQVGLCLVCGTALKDAVVHCSKCKTPHHEECWQYAGRCATFACGETSYVKDGHVLRVSGRRQTPDEWLREETARDRRETGGTLRAALRAFPGVDEALARFERRQRERRR